MKSLIQKILEQIIRKQAFINNYPKSGVVFLAIDPLLNDPEARKLISRAVVTSTEHMSFDGVASIASRGYLFSGMIAGALGDKGEFLVQKVKSKGDDRFIQIDTMTEYSSDSLQILKNTIREGKTYLLTDDLIATGGSVITAINLIRKAGGNVQTVFVMTELTDFNAREKLKQEGIDLVSLLKFTKQDLQKLLKIQASYNEDVVAPLSYQLSCHKKGVDALMASNEGEVLNVHLASKSRVKQEAAQIAFQGMFDPLAINLITHDAESGVNQQPFGYDETIEGANNRLESLKVADEHLEKAVLVAFENGIRYSKEDKQYYDFVHVVVKRGVDTFSHTEDCCYIPYNIIMHMQKNMNNQYTETWGVTAQRLEIIKDHNDPHQEEIFGGIARSERLSGALSVVLGKLKTKMMENYPEKLDDEYVEIKRLVEFKSKKSKKYDKSGIHFAPQISQREAAIDLYNQGCLGKQWGIQPETLKRNSFKVFTTGDAFAVIAPNIEVSGQDINIHVGLEHQMFSPLVLLQEALQLCRCAHEQGARSITIALPEQFHPVAHGSDFNNLLTRLFKASGVNDIYYYGADYAGQLNEGMRHATMLLSSSNLITHHQAKRLNDSQSIDSQVMQLNHAAQLGRAWGKVKTSDNVSMDAVFAHRPAATVLIPSRQPMHVLLSCSANKPLAKRIADELRARGEKVCFFDIEGQGEFARIPEEAAICGSIVTIVQSTRPNPDDQAVAAAYQINGASSYFFEAAMIAREATLRGAKQVNLINPYQFNARSDKAEDNTKGKTGSYVQHNGALLEAAGVNHVSTAECHDNHTMSGRYTGRDIRGTAVHALSIIATQLAKEWISNPEASTKGMIRLVTPDAGAAKRTKELTERMQSILGDHLCTTRVLAEKQRDSHSDISAMITSMNTGDIAINPDDNYLITDDETATGMTLCQAIKNLKNQGAKYISVIIAHNNMPLDWLTRQLCLARFFQLGAHELHFSDTQEMGTLATSYGNLITTYADRSGKSVPEVEAQILNWYKDNLSSDLARYDDFKNQFERFNTSIRIHSLAADFASKVAIQPVMDNRQRYAGLTLFASSQKPMQPDAIQQPQLSLMQ